MAPAKLTYADTEHWQDAGATRGRLKRGFGL